MSARFLPFLEFLAQEEHALLHAFAGSPAELYLFSEVNRLYRPAIERTAGATDPKLGLLGFCHVNYYLAFAGLCRGHFASAFNSIRVAIDAAFVAYRMLEEQRPNEFAFERSNYIQAKGYLVNKRKQALAHHSAEPFPKARELIGLHEFCSQYASHADPGAWQNRLLESNSVAMVYFGLRSSEARFSICAIACSATHAIILDIFAGLLIARKIWDPTTAAALHAVMSEIAKLGLKLTPDGDPLLEKLLGSFPLSTLASHSTPPSS